MSIVRIITEQAPSAKPISASLILTTQWQTIIDVPDYDVPLVGFGQSRRIAPGVAEVSSPMLIANTGAVDGRLSLRVIRNVRPLIAAQTQANFDTFVGGAGHQVGDDIELNNGAVISVDDVNGSGSVTEFTVSTVGFDVPRDSVLIQVDSSGVGAGFSLTVGDNNQSLVVGVFAIVNSFPIRPNDTQIVPLNGQFFQTGDRLQVLSDVDSILHATISYTEGQAEEDNLPEAGV